MSIGIAAVGVALRQAFADMRQQISDRQARSQALWERQKEQGLVDEAPVEPLACPACWQRFAFGYDCPDCGTPLVGVSAVAAAREAPPVEARWVGFLRGGVAGLLFGLGMLGILFFLGWLGEQSF